MWGYAAMADWKPTRGAATSEPSRDHEDNDLPDWWNTTPEAEAARVGATPIQSPEDLDRCKADFWESDEEVDEFIAFVRELRNSDVS